MITVTVRIDVAKLSQLISELPGRAEAIVKGGAEAVQGRAAALAPVDTGALKNSIHTEGRGGLVYWVADGVEYGIYQELGTSRMRAQPFMVPGAEWVRPQYTKMWKDLFK